MENNCSTNTIAKPGSEAEPKPNENTATVIREHEQNLPKETPHLPAPLTNGDVARPAEAQVDDDDAEDEEDEEGSDIIDDEEEEEDEEMAAPARNSPGRTPFTNLSQMDADLALARTLQEQERAYMMLSRVTMSMNEETDWVGASYDEDDDDFDDPDDVTDEDEFDEDEYGESEAEDGVDAFDVHAHANDEVDNDNGPDLEDDAAAFSSDEAYARALQDAEEREMAARLFALAGINDRGVEFVEHHGGHSQDTWEEVDPDELSYEELLALGEVVGTESRGLSADTIANLPSVNYKTGSNQSGTSDSCVICRLDFEDEEAVTVLSCKHSYHAECINNWLKINKVCPVCSTEVSTSGGSQASS
ncbi:E3 ubiquitin ligase BIG BROTHER-related [Linum perenne]